MKTFIIYDLDSKNARCCWRTSKRGNCAILCKRDNRNFATLNLLAEEIALKNAFAMVSTSGRSQ